MAKQYTLGRNKRLKSRKAIEQLFSNGKRFSVAPVRVVYQLSDIPGTRFGAAVSSRLFKHAVDRNRVKRILRECWRLQQSGLKTTDATAKKGLDVFFIYNERTLPVFLTMKEVTTVIIQQLNKRIHGE